MGAENVQKLVESEWGCIATPPRVRHCANGSPLAAPSTSLTLPPHSPSPASPLQRYRSDLTHRAAHSSRGPPSSTSCPHRDPIPRRSYRLHCILPCEHRSPPSQPPSSLRQAPSRVQPPAPLDLHSEAHAPSMRTRHDVPGSILSLLRRSTTRAPSVSRHICIPRVRNVCGGAHDGGWPTYPALRCSMLRLHGHGLMVSLSSQGGRRAEMAVNTDHGDVPRPPSPARQLSALYSSQRQPHHLPSRIYVHDAPRIDATLLSLPFPNLMYPPSASIHCLSMRIPRPAALRARWLPSLSPSHGFPAHDLDDVSPPQAHNCIQDSDSPAVPIRRQKLRRICPCLGASAVLLTRPPPDEARLPALPVAAQDSTRLDSAAASLRHRDPNASPPPHTLVIYNIHVPSRHLALAPPRPAPSPLRNPGQRCARPPRASPASPPPHTSALAHGYTVYLQPGSVAVLSYIVISFSDALSDLYKQDVNGASLECISFTYAVDSVPMREKEPRVCGADREARAWVRPTGVVEHGARDRRSNCARAATPSRSSAAAGSPLFGKTRHDDERAARDHQENARPKRGWRVLGQDARARERRTVDAHGPRICGAQARRAPFPRSPLSAVRLRGGSPPSAVRLRGRWARAPRCLPQPQPQTPERTILVHLPTCPPCILPARTEGALSALDVPSSLVLWCTMLHRQRGTPGPQLLLTAPVLLTLSNAMDLARAQEDAMTSLPLAITPCAWAGCIGDGRTQFVSNGLCGWWGRRRRARASSGPR
ncbi:hypothetical protein DFH08DRAFT_977087 [Mycena albidolilacea]|uniref:Uncharacterized protein n=1 Tax=Mycena albidolilacea TaxID=1033008 RepID=A0AAD6Z1Q9_9AGAR|nr:hypothetical protein DFH08DRAFT_977087 [Mycena albidolilacea]